MSRRTARLSLQRLPPIYQEPGMSVAKLGTFRGKLVVIIEIDEAENRCRLIYPSLTSDDMALVHPDWVPCRHVTVILNECVRKYRAGVSSCLKVIRYWDFEKGCYIDNEKIVVHAKDKRIAEIIQDSSDVEIIDVDQAKHSEKTDSGIVAEPVVVEKNTNIATDETVDQAKHSEKTDSGIVAEPVVPAETTKPAIDEAVLREVNGEESHSKKRKRDAMQNKEEKLDKQIMRLLNNNDSGMGMLQLDKVHTCLGNPAVTEQEVIDCVKDYHNKKWFLHEGGIYAL